MADVNVQEFLNIAPKFSDLRQKPQGVHDITTDAAAIPNSSHKRIRYDYDQEVDVLYLTFGDKPRPADDSELTDDDLIIRYDDGEIIGVTILNASRHTTAD